MKERNTANTAGNLFYAVAVTTVAVVLVSVVISRFCWFKTYEHVALWLEGIALVLIFVWDRIDHNDQHKETMAQIAIAERQSRFALNVERAWLTPVLRWSEGAGRIVFNESSTDEGTRSTTGMNLVIEIKNDGKTPAWIEYIGGGAEIDGASPEPERALLPYGESIAAEKSYLLHIPLTCEGRVKETEIVRAHFTIVYRDIFESREIYVAFSINTRTFALRRLTVDTLSAGKTSVDF